MAAKGTKARSDAKMGLMKRRCILFDRESGSGCDVRPLVLMSS